MLLIIFHFGNDPTVGCYLTLWNSLSNKLKQMVLKSHYQFRQQSVIFLLVFAGREATVDRHSTTIKYYNYIPYPQITIQIVLHYLYYYNDQC